MTELNKRYDFMLMFDVQDGNPNGDPDAGNLPRIDPETGHGIVTDVCLKRKVRNYVLLTRGKDPYDIFVKERAVLNNKIGEAYRALEIDLEQAPSDAQDGKKRNEKGKGQGGEVFRARDKMCAQYFDIRSFGAVLSTGPNAGQVRGPVQLTFGRSVDPIVTLEHSITRMAVATEKEAEDQGGDNRTMGRKNTVPYGLYVAHGFVSAYLARQTGFTSQDLEVLWESLKNMFEHDRSAARGLMSTCKLLVFEHDSALGNASSSSLFRLIHVERKRAGQPPRGDFSQNYAVAIDKTNLPNGVQFTEHV